MVKFKKDLTIMQQGSILSNLLQLILMIGAIWLFSKFACSNEEHTTITEEEVEVRDTTPYDFTVHKADRIMISEQLAEQDCETTLDYEIRLSLIYRGLGYKLDSLEYVLKKDVKENKITPREAGMITNNYIKNLFKH